MVRRSDRVNEFYRAARAGRFHRLVEGVYLPEPTWREMDADARFRASIHAAQLASREGLVFSHLSAAALWRLPMVGTWPARAEVTVGTKASGPVRRAFTARQYPVPQATDIIDGLTVTTLPRTLIDVGRTRQLVQSVPMLDYALAPKAGAEAGVGRATATFGDLATELSLASSVRGTTRCRDAIALADGRSGSPGESLSRVGMFLLALPMPDLQHEFRDAAGRMVVDFWWPDFGIVGEFDGFGKYLREDLLGGQSTADAVLAEKRREDRLRALGPRVTRWGWDVARSPALLGQHLRGAGLR
jgi:hypothetical protein